MRQMGAEQRSISLEAFLLVVGTRVALHALPFGTVLGVYRRLHGGVLRFPVLRARAVANAGQVASAIQRAGRHTPGATCLTQALAGHVMLARYGVRSALRIGVRKDRTQGFAAHAWLERDGSVILGGAVDQFAPFPPFGYRSR